MEDKITLDDQIDRLLNEMYSMEVDSEEYSQAVKNLNVLMDARKRKSVSPEAILGAVTNIAGILLILNYEQLNVISSRAIQFIRRSS